MESQALPFPQPKTSSVAHCVSTSELSRLLGFVRCPQCRAGRLRVNATFPELICQTCYTNYPLANGRPVLLRPDNGVFRRENYSELEGKKSHAPARRWEHIIPSPSINLAREKALARVGANLALLPASRVLVVGGGGQRESLDEQLHASSVLDVVYSDIDVNADVDLFCDAHDLPFFDSVFDAVITTAVLEHVLYPERAASEIHRVLKLGGILYSELPFMQQVHEGAYDFTRYTLSGHRRLFNGFSEIESGLVAGPGTALIWAIENLVLAFSKRRWSRSAGKAAVRLMFFWIKYLDRFLVKRPQAMDGASCTYFLGGKIDGQVADVDIIARYIGAKHVQHN